MAGRWEHSDRRARLPSNWPQLRTMARLRAGGRCQWVDGDGRCGEPGSDCDHIAAGDNHDLSNLQWLCRHHHKIKSSQEGNTAPRVSRFRKPRPHPAL